MCRALLCGDDSSHSQSQSGKRLLLASIGHPVRTPLYHGSCIDPTHQSHTLDLTPDLPFPITQLPIRLLIKDTAGNDFLQVWTNLCYRECFCKTNCWQELHFEFSGFSGFMGPGELGSSSIPSQTIFWTPMYYSNIFSPS